MKSKICRKVKSSTLASTMIKNTLFYENQTLGIKSYLLHLSFGFYTLFHCDLELMVEGRSYPCIRIVFLLNSHKSYMSVPIQVSAVSVPIGYWCFFIWGYRYRLERYRYRLANVKFKLGCTGTGLSGTGTTASALVSQHCCTSRNFTKRLPSSSTIHIRFLDTNPCNNYV